MSDDNALPDDETELRRRLDQLRAARPEIEKATERANNALLAHIGQLADAIRGAEPPANAKELKAVNETLTALVKSLHDAWVATSEEEARTRQALSILTAERLTTASIRSAHSTMWASWAMVVVALATMVVALVR